MTLQLRDRPEPRTYHGWHNTRSFGLFGLSTGATLAGFACAGLVILLLLFNRNLGLIVAGISLLVLAPLGYRKNGRSGAQIMAARLAWAAGKRSRKHLYVAGLASPYTRTHRLPGILAASQLLSVDNGSGKQMGVISLPSTRHYTVVLCAQSEGVDLVDQDVIDQRVARWGAWLSSLSIEPDLVQAQVTIETAPDPGDRLAEEVASTTVAGAPDLAVKVLGEIVEAYPAGAATTAYYVALTFKLTRGDHAACALELAKKLPQLRNSLEGTGAVGIVPASPDRLIRTVARAYDPARAEAINAAPAELLDWADAGPAEHDQDRNTYHHASGSSRTWGLVNAPSSAIIETTFSRLAVPDPELVCKRVSLMYRPMSPTQGVRTVDQDIRDAENAAKNRRGGPTARDEVRIKAARQAAQEEARGAAVTQFSILATLTVPRGADLDAPSRKLTAAAAEARVLLREMAGQPAVFGANLPTGVVLPVHATVPS